MNQLFIFTHLLLFIRSTSHDLLPPILPTHPSNALLADRIVLAHWVPFGANPAHPSTVHPRPARDLHRHRLTYRAPSLAVDVAGLVQFGPRWLSRRDCRALLRSQETTRRHYDGLAGPLGRRRRPDRRGGLLGGVVRPSGRGQTTQ